MSAQPDQFMEAMRRGWSGGLPDGTVCGKGSMLRNTDAVRAWLPEMAARYGVRSVCDAGAGDLHWMRHVTWDVQYFPVDLIPRHPSVCQLDITSEVLPQADLIICRFVLQHLPRACVLSALNLFRQSGNRYLAVTQHDSGPVAKEDAYNKWDFRGEPFAMGAPVERVPDSAGGDDCSLSLWRIES